MSAGLAAKEATESLDWLIGEWSEDPLMEEAVIDAVQKLMALYRAHPSYPERAERVLKGWIEANTRPTTEPVS